MTSPSEAPLPRSKGFQRKRSVSTKRFRFVLLVILLLACCIAVLGCSGKEALVGVYQRQSSGNTNSAGNRIIRIRTETLLKEAEHKMLFETLRMIQDVKTIASCTEKGNSWDYKLTVVDNCLVADSYPLDTVYVKVGE